MKRAGHVVGLLLWAALAVSCAWAERSVTMFVAITGSPTAEDVDRKLDALCAGGVDSFMFYPVSGMSMEYLGEDFFRCAERFAAGAERRGMKMWLYDEYNWPSGSCRGKVPAENERWRYTEVSYHRSATGGVDKVLSHGPAGWVSLLEPDAVERFIELTYGAYSNRLARWIGNGTIPGVFTDEPGHPVAVEVPPNPICRWRWWSSLEADYLAETGRDFSADAATNAVDAAAYARLFGRKFRSSYYDKVRAVTDGLGIKFCGHLIGDDSAAGSVRVNGDPLLTLRGETFPGIDEIWSVIDPAKIPFYLYALADHAISRTGRGGMVELFACGPANMSPERMRRMVWLCALHGVTRYFTVMSAMDQRWMEQMRGFTTVVGEQQPWFAEFKTFMDEADRASAFAKKRVVRDAAVRLPIDALARGVFGDMKFPPIEQLLRELELSGFTPDLIAKDEKSSLPVVFSFEGNAIVEESSGRRFPDATKAVAFLAEVRPVEGRRRNVLLRRYEDGTRAELDLSPIRPSVPADLKPVVADWKVRLESPNRKRINFACDGSGVLRVAQPIKGVRMVVRQYVPNPELEDSKLIAYGSMCEGHMARPQPYRLSLNDRPLVATRKCTCLLPGYDELYLMTEPFDLPAGEHRLKIVSGRMDDNYFLPVCIVAGDFAESPEGLRPLSDAIPLVPLAEAGLPGYAGVVTYTATVDIPAGKRLCVASGNAFTRVQLDDADLGVRAWAPFTWQIPQRLVGKGRKLTIKVYTSQLPLFGDPKAQGTQWKRPFWIDPATPESAPGLATVGFVPDGSSHPFLMLRLRAVETDRAETWAETRQAIAENPGCCDEVWFSTGISYPPLSAHRAAAARQAAAAEDCRKLGIEPGLQIQATLGHSDDIGASGGDMSAKNWTGWTGSQGVVDRYCSCPRDPKFIAYFEEVARIYAAYRPSSVWIDDDLRIDNHRPATGGSPNGCWCARCLADFSRVEGRDYTRESLLAATKADRQLYGRWQRFQFGSLAELARRITKAVVSVSPETRMGYQHAYRADGLQKMVFDAMFEASGHAVRSRPGGGAYYDHDPHDQIDKAYMMMAQRASLAGAKAIDMFCPEIETWPRTFACRTPRGVLLESVENLALGMDSLSLLITDSRYEKMSWYGNAFFKALAANRSCLKAFADRNVGTEPAGLFVDAVTPEGKANAVGWRECCSGIPLVLGIGHRTGSYADLVKRMGGKLDVTVASSGTIVRRAHLADEIAGGRLPVVLEDPFVGLIVPRTTREGELRTVAVINATIGRTAPTRLRLRGVPANVKAISWWALDENPVPASFVREGQDVIVTLPSIEGWSAGWLNLQ